MTETDHTSTNLPDWLLLVSRSAGLRPGANQARPPNAPGRRPALLVAACFALLCQCLPLRADQGQGVSDLFTTDTRWGFSDGAAVSGFFQVDTRLSGSASDASYGLFTMDTIGAGIGNARFVGYVTDTPGASLGGVTVSALQNDVMRGQAGTDASGYYQINSLPAGTYVLRAEKANYLTGLRYGVNVSASETKIQSFALEGRPAAPVVVATTRPAEPARVVAITDAQLKGFVGGTFVVDAAFDRTKMTVVFTHGWLSDPSVWAASMAGQMTGAGVTDANLLAWDWEQAADASLSAATSATPGQGAGLGRALAATFGPTYQQPVHFIGHSLGTLVNAGAANHLHANPTFAWLANKTHMTLLDDAEAANVVSTADYVSPIPWQRAWIDSYVSLVGLYHPEAVNVYLVKSPYYADAGDPIALLQQVHRYACRWYGKSIEAPNRTLIGNRYSFERLGSAAQLSSAAPYALGSELLQDITSGEELALTAPPHTQQELDAASLVWSGGLAAYGLHSSVRFVQGVVQAAGATLVEVTTAMIPGMPSGTPVFTGTADSTPAYYVDNGVQQTPVWSLQLNLQTTPPPPRPPRAPKDGGDPTNAPVMVWIPVAVPTNAAIFSFDFSLAGDPAEDSLSVNIAGTNVFALEGEYMPTNRTLNSGPIDVSRWAGQTVEFFFGLLGGTSTNATVTVGAMRFYQVEPPQLQVEQSGPDVVLSWPAAALDYTLVSVSSLADTNWQAVTNAPVLSGLRQQVTNSASAGSRFYRLRKP